MNDVVRANLHLCDPYDLQGGEALLIPFDRMNLSALNSYLLRHTSNDTEPRQRFARLKRKSEVDPRLFARCSSKSASSLISVDIVVKMMPAGAPRANIEKYLPVISEALTNEGLADQDMVLMAIATIRAESGGFVAISEGVSKYNTSAEGRKNKHLFDLYDDAARLGNKGRPDGESYKGRGFIQLTGRYNYGKYSADLGLGTQLIDTPELANSPTVAAQLLAGFLKDVELRIRDAIKRNDLSTQRGIDFAAAVGMRALIKFIED